MKAKISIHFKTAMLLRQTFFVKGKQQYCHEVGLIRDGRRCELIAAC
jgi:hypothetical protein